MRLGTQAAFVAGLSMFAAVVGMAVFTLPGCKAPVVYTPPDNPPEPPVPTPPGPTPVDPGPGPTPVPGTGDITEAQYADVADDTIGADGVVRVGTSEENMVLRLGPPLSKAPVAGQMKYVYTMGPSHIAWFFVSNGRVVRKSRI